MAWFPVEVLFGIYLGILTGIVPALVAWALGFLFKYVTNVTLPGFGVVVLAVALAGINGGLLALADPTILASANAVTVTTGLLVVMMMTLYAHAQGDSLGSSLPRRLSLRKLGEQTLSADLTEIVSGRREIRIRVEGSVDDVEGYPPLSAELRASIREGEWTFPADLPISELESRLAERLRTEFDLGEARVSIDDRGRARVAAAPSFSGLSRRVSPGNRAVSVAGLVPTGLARGDLVTAITPTDRVDGTVLSARSETTPSTEPTATDGGDDTDALPEVPRAPTTRGGDGQITLSVTRSDVGPLLAADRITAVVRSRGSGSEYQVISMFRRSGRRFRRLTVRAGGQLDGETLGDADVRSTFGVAVLAVRTAGGWQFAPDGTVAISAGYELFAVGSAEALDTFAEAVA